MTRQLRLSAGRSTAHLLLDELGLDDARDLGVGARVQVVAHALALLRQPPLRLAQVVRAVAARQVLLRLRLQIW